MVIVIQAPDKPLREWQLGLSEEARTEKTDTWLEACLRDERRSVKELARGWRLEPDGPEKKPTCDHHKEANLLEGQATVNHEFPAYRFFYIETTTWRI